MTLTYVTSNENKLQEAEAVLGRPMERQDLDLPEIQAVELASVAEYKVKEACEHVEPPVMVSDTGLFFDGLNGFPGALIKWFYKRLGNDGICARLPDDERGAEATTMIALHTGEQIITATGTIEGTVPPRPQGTGGFGWDPIFQPLETDETFASMSQERKNEISMRKRALEALREEIERVDAEV